MPFTRTFEIITKQAPKYKNSNTLAFRNSFGNWETYSHEHCQNYLFRYAEVLKKLGLSPGDYLLMAPELALPDWILIDLAAQHAGIIVVLIPSTTSVAHFSLIFEEVQPKLTILKDKSWVGKYFEKYPQDHARTLDEIRQIVEETNTVEYSWLEAIGNNIKATDLSCIIYTSGTTGNPKGVMLSHANIVSNVQAAMPLFPLNLKSRVLSFLPYSHIFERTAIYCYLALGVSIYCIGDRNNFTEGLETVKPHFFTAVPRIIEKMYQEGMVYRSQKNWLGRKLIDWAVGAGVYYNNQKRFKLVSWLKLLLSRYFIFRRFKKLLGRDLIGIVVGAAHLKPELAKIFAVAGIKLREGYGMTETSPIVTINRFTPGLFAFGTVGIPISNVQVRIDEPDENGAGEILIKGPNVMLGYFKDPESTRQAFTPEGWFKTGDVGKYSQKRFLVITDRKKNIFKTSSGKYIAPQLLEQYLQKSNFIDQVMVIGFQRPYVTALIYPDYVQLERWAVDNGIHWTSPKYMAHNIKVKAKIQEEINDLNQGLPNHEKIRKFYLLDKEWDVASGQLSSTMKIIRENIAAAFEKEIAAMYQE